MKWFYQALEHIVWLTQLGLSMLMPLLLCLAACWWLTTRMGVGFWVYIPGFLLGLCSGGVSFARFAHLMMRKADKDSKNAPTGFNRHD